MGELEKDASGILKVDGKIRLPDSASKAVEAHKDDILELYSTIADSPLRSCRRG
jgi:hypothetical protein